MDFKDSLPTLPDPLSITGAASYEQLEALLHGQSEILEMISRGISRPLILEKITRWVEKQNKEKIYTAIHILDDAGKELHLAAAPSMPALIKKSFDRLPVQTGMDSCGEATLTQQPVIVEDLTADPAWARCQQIFHNSGIMACWSMPLMARDGKVIGTFSIYYLRPHQPLPDEWHAIRLISRTVVLAIEHTRIREEERKKEAALHERQKALQESELRFRSMIEQAPVAMGVLKGEQLVVETANDSLLLLWGKDSSVIGLPLMQALPEIKDQPFQELLQNVFRTGEPYYGFETLARLVRNGKPEECYFNFVYAPFIEENKITGVQVVANEVTFQFKAKKALAASEERFRNLILNAPMATALYTGKDMIISLANEAMIRLWGKDESVIGQPLDKALPELEGQPFMQLLQQVFTSGKPYQATEDRAVLEVDGRPQAFYFNFTYKPLFNDEGKVNAIINMAVDVTQTVLARQKIEQQEAYFRKMTDTVPTIIWITDVEGRANFLNVQWFDYTGQTQEKAYGKGWLEAIHPDDAKKTENAFFNALQQQKAVQFIYRLRKKDGSYRWFLDMATPRFDASGNFEGYTGSVVDIHENKVMQEKLAHAEERLRLAADGTGLGTWDLDLVNKSIIYSPVLNQIFGGSPDAVLSHPEMRALLHPFDLQNIVEPAYEKALQTGYYEYEARVQQADGSLKWIRTQGRMVFQEGKAVRMLGTMMDITERKNAMLALAESEQRYRELSEELEMRVQQRTQDLVQANDNLERSNAELGQYAYVASHDLQEPLRKIRIFSGMLKDQDGLNAEGNRLLSKIISSSDRMSLLIRDLLEYSRLLKAGKTVQPTNLNQVLAQVKEDFELSIQEKGSLVKAAQLPVLEAVPLQMNQLFNNLFSNALKFTRDFVTPTIDISSRTLDEKEIAGYGLNTGKKYYEIVFADNGIGFAPMFAEQIFDVFKRLHTRHAYPGSGIGLAVCRKIVEHHGGLMFAEAEEGSGARFHVILPENQGYTLA